MVWDFMDHDGMTLDVAISASCFTITSRRYPWKSSRQFTSASRFSKLLDSQAMCGKFKSCA